MSVELQNLLFRAEPEYAIFWRFSGVKFALGGSKLISCGADKSVVFRALKVCLFARRCWLGCVCVCACLRVYCLRLWHVYVAIIANWFLCAGQRPANTSTG